MSAVADLGADLQAASDALRASWEAERAETEAEVPEEVLADSARVRAALEDGGRALLTLRSRRTGKHVKVNLVAKKKDPSGGWVSRASKAGRVGIREADVVFADDPDQSWPDGALGRFDPRTGEWTPQRTAEANRLWAAEKLLAWALGSYPLIDEKAEVYLSTICCVCGKQLRHPESVERGIGPECARKGTKGRPAARLTDD
jgi:hypothetical protein